MIAAGLEKIAEDVAGRILRGGAGIEVRDVVTDSREDCAGALFAPLEGEHHDGHDHVEDAVKKGAVGFLWSREEEPPDAGGAAVIKVMDTLKAYQAAGRANRERSGAKVIGLTGSSGKTTTKGFLANLLSGHRTVSTLKNENNEVGVPKTLLRLKEDTEYAVIEMGMRARGEIEELASLARPDYGLITNVGLTHVGRLGSEKEVALAKGEMLDYVNPAGKVFLNADNGWTPMLARMSPAEVVTFGMNSGDVRSGNERYTLEEVSFTVVVGGSGEEFEINAPAPGKAGVYNALSAAAVGISLGMSETEIAERLSLPVREEGRMRKLRTGNGKVILDDSYNANPCSVRLAMDLMGRVEWKGRKVAVLADMLELGERSGEEHFKVGRECAKFVDVLITMGKDAARIAEGARESGKIAAGNVFPFGEFEELAPEAARLFESGDLILVKGSRGMKMERVVKMLVGK